MDELEALDFMPGDWAVVSVTQDADGAWIETPATATIRLRLDGCLIEETWEGRLAGRPHRFVRWLAYDRGARTWQRAHVDDGHGSLLTARGAWRDGRLRLFVSQYRNGSLLLDRTTITPTGEDGFLRVLESSYDGGETWNEVWTMRCRRTADEAEP